MKKSLVALAVMSLAGAAFAQSTVSVSGKLGYAYQSTESAGAAPVKANGLTVTDGDFVLAASEDLGGGLKASASMAVQSRGRDTAIAARDASISLAGGFGSVTIGAIELGNGLVGFGSADAPTIGLDGPGVVGIARDVLSAPLTVDVLLYSSPDMNGLSFQAAYFDQSTAAALAGTGGGQSAALGYDGTLIGVSYAKGALAATADFTKFDKNAIAVGLNDRLRMSASYDLGAVKLGAGYEKLVTTAAINNGETQTMVGVSAPVSGNVSVGATYARNTQDGANDVTGYELGVNYSLSKRTGVQVAYRNISESTVAGSATDFRIRLMHSF